jgi:uncharacterized protein YbjT (DUF2867 family)
MALSVILSQQLCDKTELQSKVEQSDIPREENQNRSLVMFAITGITGQVGGIVADRLLETGAQIRAVVRNAEKAAVWKEKGCELAVAEMSDAAALASAFDGMEGVFIVIPPVFDPQPGFPEVTKIIAALKTALEAARPKRVVSLSTIGAQATQFNLLSQHTLVEQALLTLPMPVTFLRPAWFMENSAWDVVPAKATGIIPSFLQPLDKSVPVVAVADIGALGANLLQQTWSGVRIVELEGPARVTPNAMADAFAKALRKPVRMEPVPRHCWEQIFREQAMNNPEPRMRMLDGFNEGWIEFEGGEASSLKGKTAFETVIARLVANGE